MFDDLAQALREELGGIRDTLDVFVHSGRRDSETLRPLIDRLGHISETFGLLGFDKARRLVKAERSALIAMTNGVTPLDDIALMNLAGMMLNIESVVGTYLGARTKALPGDGEEEFARREFEAVESVALYRGAGRAGPGEGNPARVPLGDA